MIMKNENEKWKMKTSAKNEKYLAINGNEKINEKSMAWNS